MVQVQDCLQSIYTSAGMGKESWQESIHERIWSLGSCFKL